METDNAVTSVQNNPMANKKQILFILVTIFSFIALETEANCQRTALIKDQVIYIDTPDGKKGEGLKAYFKPETDSYRYLEKYQNNLKLSKYSKLTGTIATGGLLTGLFYQGSDQKRNNIVLISGVIAGVNFLIQKTFLFYNEENLQKSIDQYNKANKTKIQMNVFNSELKKYSISAVWSF